MGFKVSPHDPQKAIHTFTNEAIETVSETLTTTIGAPELATIEQVMVRPEVVEVVGKSAELGSVSTN